MQAKSSKSASRAGTCSLHKSLTQTRNMTVLASSNPKESEKADFVTLRLLMEQVQMVAGVRVVNWIGIR